MEATSYPVLLDAVLATHELKRRPSRAPDFEAEGLALLDLARELTIPGSNILEKLVDRAHTLCGSHSAGISLLEDASAPGYPTPSGNQFRWHAVAGRWAPMVWNTLTQRDDSPCGAVIDRNATQLFSRAYRYYRQFDGVEPPLVEALLAPFYVEGRPVGLCGSFPTTNYVGSTLRTSTCSRPSPPSPRRPTWFARR